MEGLRLFSVYLRSASNFVSEKTVTASPDEARGAFKALTERADLDGTAVRAVLLRDGRDLALHDFENPVNPRNWRGRTQEINMKAGLQVQM